MKAYIQRVLGEIPDDWVFSAMLGFKNKGFEIKYFEEEDIDRIPCNMETVVVGYIEPTLKYFELNGIQIPKPLNIPDELNDFHFLGRKIGIMTMGDLMNNSTIHPIFVKPYSKLKQFDSGVIERQDIKKYVFKDIPHDALVQTSETIDFISEWRVFIHNRIIKGIQFYKGD